MQKTFYIETFGCQMNAHDSEKVVGTLLRQGYSQVDTADEANYVFFNTCSIRDKAEQKVFNRLQHFKRQAKEGKVFAVIGCVAWQAAGGWVQRSRYRRGVSSEQGDAGKGARRHCLDR